MNTEYEKSFLRDLKKVKDEVLKGKIADIVDAIKRSNGLSEIHDLKPIRGHKTFYRIRVGSHRIGIQAIKDTVIFHAFGDRKDIYKRFP